MSCVPENECYPPNGNYNEGHNDDQLISITLNGDSHFFENQNKIEHGHLRSKSICGKWYRDGLWHIVFRFHNVNRLRLGYQFVSIKQLTSTPNTK